MSLADELTEEVSAIFRNTWTTRDGRVVPEGSSMKLGNDAVKITATVLYADLAQSTSLVEDNTAQLAAEVYKAYLRCACRIIRAEGGAITAFDGDRVMAVYTGETPNTNAARTALKINYAVTKIINPQLRAVYKNKGDFEVRQAVGIDKSELFVAQTGIRGSNDLVWVGRAANYAAKLCSLRQADYTSWITEDVYNTMTDNAKIGSDGRNMWEKRTWTAKNMTVYRSNWTWTM